MGEVAKSNLPKKFLTREHIITAQTRFSLMTASYFKTGGSWWHTKSTALWPACRSDSHFA